jgi:hypothetical protein
MILWLIRSDVFVSREAVSHISSVDEGLETFLIGLAFERHLHPEYQNLDHPQTRETKILVFSSNSTIYFIRQFL